MPLEDDVPRISPFPFDTATLSIVVPLTDDLLVSLNSYFLTVEICSPRGLGLSLGSLILLREIFYKLELTRREPLRPGQLLFVGHNLTQCQIDVFEVNHHPSFPLSLTTLRFKRDKTSLFTHLCREKENMVYLRTPRT